MRKHSFYCALNLCIVSQDARIAHQQNCEHEAEQIMKDHLISLSFYNWYNEEATTPNTTISITWSKQLLPWDCRTHGCKRNSKANLSSRKRAKRKKILHLHSNVGGGREDAFGSVALSVWLWFSLSLSLFLVLFLLWFKVPHEEW